MSQSCSECQHYQRTRVGPHEWKAGCGIGIIDFLHAEHCPYYQPEPPQYEEADDHWPFSAGLTAPVQANSAALNSGKWGTPRDA